MRKPLEVFAVDGGMNRATGSIPYRSLMWTRRYTKPGEFSMVVPANVYDPKWAYIVCDDRPETGIIQKVEFNDDSQVYGGIDSITLSGFFFEQVLNNIVFLVESPEQQKVYVPKPKRPSFSHSKQDVKVYTDTVGGYYYVNKSGDMVSADTGKVVTGGGLVEVDYHDAFGNMYGNPDQGICSFDYYTNSDKTQITTVPYHGDDHGQPGETYDIVFEDDCGNVFYNKNGTLTQAVGVVDSYQDTYQVRKKAWDALDGDLFGHYYTVTVKGPWQRTEAMEPITEGDSIDIVFKWAQRMMGDWILYEEPKIEGIQKTVDPSFQYLGDLLFSTLYEVGASLRLEYLFERNVLILSVYRGHDRTQEQTSIPWAVFSDTWGTIKDYTAMRDESNYKNTCFVLYDYDVPNSFDENGWPHADFIMRDGDYLALPTLYGIPYTSKRGYNTEHQGDDGEEAIETYLDLRDEKPSCDSLWSRDIVELPGVEGSEREQAIQSAKEKFGPPSDASADEINLQPIYEAYEAQLPGRGTQHLKENYYVVTNLDTGTVNTDGYLRDFDLGDMVEFGVSTVGLMTTGRIIEVEELYESNDDSVSSDIRITVGDETLTNIQKAALARK